MRILLIDTCGATGSVAIADTACEPAIVAFASLPGRTASERLVPTIKQLVSGSETNLQSAGNLPSLEAVVVVHGPGSFTGVRVGLSAAKGLCDALALPLIAISRLAVLASLAQVASLAQGSLSTPVRALLDAGRGEFYSGVYVDGVCQREALLTREELLAEAVRPNKGDPLQIVVVCETSVAASVAVLAPQLVAEPTSAEALPLALDHIQRRAFDDVALIDANYLRRTDAEIFAKPTAHAVASHQSVVIQSIGNQTETPAR